VEKIERISRRGQAVKDHEAYVKESRSNWDYVDETRLGEIILAMNEEEAARLPKHSRKLYQELQAEKTVQQEAGEQGFAQQELAREQEAHRQWMQQELQSVGVRATAEQNTVVEAANAAYERLLTEGGKDGIKDNGNYYANADEEPYLQKQLNYYWNGKPSFIPKGTVFEKVITLAGQGGTTEIRDIRRLVHDYGGEAGTWKKQLGRISSDKHTFDIHWYEYEGIQYDIKIKYRKEKK